MAPEEVIKEMQKTSIVLQERLVDIVPLTTVVAYAQQDYRISLAKEIIKLRLDGVSVSLAEIIAKGNPEVARLKVNHVISEAERTACLKSIAVNMSVADTNRSLLKASKDENTSSRKNYYD